MGEEHPEVLVYKINKTLEFMDFWMMITWEYIDLEYSLVTYADL